MDTEKLKALALAANDLPDTTQPFVSSTGQVVICTFSLKGEQLHTVGNFYDAANPATVLELIAEVERLRAELATWCRADGGNTSEKDGLLDTHKTAETRMDSGFAGGLLGSAPAARTEKDAELSESSTNKIREAIADYYLALNARHHGHLAMDRAFRSIERELGMSWDMWTRAEQAAIEASNQAKESQ